MTRGLGHEYSHASCRFSKKSVAGAERHLADVGAGEAAARRCGSGSDGDGTSAASPGWSSTHIRWREALLGADGVDDLGVGVELDAEAAQVEVGDGLAQLRDAPARRVAVVAGVVRRLGQLVDGDRRATGRSGLPKPRSITSLAGSPGLDLQPIDDGEDVRRQRGDPAELHGAHGSPRRSGGPNRVPVARRAAEQRRRASSTGADGPGVGPQRGGHDAAPAGGGRAPGRGSAKAVAGRGQQQVAGLGQARRR